MSVKGANNHPPLTGRLPSPTTEGKTMTKSMKSRLMLTNDSSDVLKKIGFIILFWFPFTATLAVKQYRGAMAISQSFALVF